MTGKASKQPGGRAPAPAELSLVQAFVNSHYDLEHEHGAELLSTPDRLAEWLRGHDLLDGAPQFGPADLGRALVVRERLRDLARANGAEGGKVKAGRLQQLNAAAAGATVELRFGPRSPRVHQATRDRLDGALGRLLAITAVAMIDGTWRQLKVCPGQDCGWAFYDHSRNQTGRWCSMAVCGGRAKVQAHYRRRRALL
jgi:predicted RNA-binding Zn ribbon-like protein